MRLSEFLLFLPLKCWSHIFVPNPLILGRFFVPGTEVLSVLWTDCIISWIICIIFWIQTIQEQYKLSKNRYKLSRTEFKIVARANSNARATIFIAVFLSIEILCSVGICSQPTHMGYINIRVILGIYTKKNWIFICGFQKCHLRKIFQKLLFHFKSKSFNVYFPATKEKVFFLQKKKLLNFTKVVNE